VPPNDDHPIRLANRQVSIGEYNWAWQYMDGVAGGDQRFFQPTITVWSASLIGHALSAGYLGTERHSDQQIDPEQGRRSRLGAWRRGATRRLVSLDESATVRCCRTPRARRPPPSTNSSIPAT
jgi:hypothetical protein